MAAVSDRTRGSRGGWADRQQLGSSKNPQRNSSLGIESLSGLGARPSLIRVETEPQKCPEGCPTLPTKPSDACKREVQTADTSLDGSTCATISRVSALRASASRREMMDRHNRAPVHGEGRRFWRMLLYKHDFTVSHPSRSLTAVLTFSCEVYFLLFYSLR